MFTTTKMLNYREIKEQFPNVVEKLRLWVGNNLKTFQENMARLSKSENLTIPEISGEVVEKAVEATVQMVPRDLYCFFDSYKIFVLIDYIFEEGFIVNLIGADNKTKAFDTRREAEAVGFMDAFKILNEQ